VGGPVLALAALAGATQLNAIDSTVEDVTAGSRIADDVRSGKISPTQAAKMVDAAKRRNSRTGVSDIAADTARKFGVAGAIDAATDYAAGRGIGSGTDLNNQGMRSQQSISIANSKELGQAIADAMAKTTTTTPTNPNRNAPISSAPRGGTQ
jgi:hypothetical protein